MDTDQARGLFERYRGSVAYVEVETPKGDRRIGSAFHVGDGVFVTARHVVEGNEIRSVGTTESVYISLEGEEAATARTYLHTGGASIPVHQIEPSTFTVVSGPHLAIDAPSTSRSSEFVISIPGRRTSSSAAISTTGSEKATSYYRRS